MRSGLVTILSVSVWLASCGGGGGGADPTPAPPPPPPPQSTASFMAASSGTAQAPLAFDASASTSSDGSALTYRWNFGDGQLGNGAKIAHAFGAAGSFSVTLTVTDSASRSATASKAITVAAATAPGPTVAVLGVIHGVDGLALDGVTATAPDGTTASSNAMGKLSITLGTDVPLLVRLTKAGYADQFVSVSMPHTAGADAEFQAVMRPRNAFQSFDAAAGGSLTTPDGAKLTLPANGVVDGAGAVVSGAIDVAMTPVDVTLPGGGGFPGTYDGVNTDATSTPLVSFGTTEFVLSRNGQRLQVAPGKTATIELPLAASRKLDGTLVAAGDSIPLWSLDEKTGLWINEGSGTVVASAAAASGLAMRAQVAHFSWWNIDIGFEPYGPRPDCREDTAIGLPAGAPAFATATFCNFLAEFEQPDGSGNKAALPQAAAIALPRWPGYARRLTVAIPGGPPIQPFPVPANNNIVLSATALNGTWTGRKVINGPVGQIDTVTVLMRPIATSGDESITLPFDATRSLNAGQTARFTFTGGPPKYAVVHVERSNSTLTGTVKLLRGTSVLASADFGDDAADLAFALPDTGPYTIEVVNNAGAVGAYHLTASLAGGVVDESFGTPFDVSRALAQYTTHRVGFDVDAVTGVLLNLRRTAGADVTLRMRDAAGNLLTTMSTVSGNPPSTAVTLPAAGHYVLEVTSTAGATASFRVSGETTRWVTAGPTLPADPNSQLVDLQADRNGAPTVAWQLSVPTQTTIQRTIRLRRFAGNAWSDVSTDLRAIARPCTGLGESLAFDADNHPVIAYGERDEAGQGASVTVLRFDGTAWVAVGPNGGKLPGTDSFGATCQFRPVIRVAPDGAVTVAHLVDNNVAVHRFDGTNWVGFTGSGGDSIPTFGGAFDFRFDPSGRPVLVYRSTGGNGLSARRLSTGTPAAWQPLGTGALPLTPTLVDVFTPRLRFDASGQPIVATFASVPTGELTFTGGLAVFRFDGSDWQTTGGYRVTDDGRVDVNGAQGPGFMLADGEALLAFFATTGSSVGRPMVHRNTAAGYAPLGQNLGEIPQLYMHGLNPAGARLNYLLEGSGPDTWLAVMVQPLDVGNLPKDVALLKLVH